MAPSVISTSLTDVSGNVDTTLNYYLSPSKGGDTSFQAGSAYYYRRKFDEHPIHIHDIRGEEAEYNLNKQGFQHLKHTTAEKDYSDENQVKRVVYPEVEKLLKKVTGATRVHVWSHITRRDSRDKMDATIAANPSLADDALITQVTPARYIHIDQSDHGALQVLLDNMPTEALTLQRTRWSIINVWRPITGPITKDPLAVCDSRTVKDEELMPVQAYFPQKGSGSQYADISAGKTFENCAPVYSPEHRWFFVSGMDTDEVLLIKCFDSLRDGKTARRVPHSAFSDPRTKNLDVVRESVEVRALVFWEDQPAE